MTQRNLFDTGDESHKADLAAKKAAANGNLARVADNVGDGIKDFAVLFRGRDWHMRTLVEYLESCDIRFSPDSPSRVLRMLKKQGELNYEVLSRSESRYRFI